LADEIVSEKNYSLLNNKTKDLGFSCGFESDINFLVDKITYECFYRQGILSAMKQVEFTREENLFRQKGGALRTSEALRLGIHPRKLYQLRDEGKIIELSRGVFQLAEFAASSYTDLVAVSARVPDGIVCLISALSFHEITTEIPHEVYLAVPRRSDFAYPDWQNFAQND